MFLDWKKTILEQTNNDRIALHTAKWMCTIVLPAKFTKRVYLLWSRKGNSSPIVWSIVTSPLISLMGNYFCSSGYPTTCLYSFLLLCDERQLKDESHLRTQYKDPWTGFKLGPIDLLRVCDSNHCAGGNLQKTTQCGGIAAWSDFCW